jgi:hypothetical protein
MKRETRIKLTSGKSQMVEIIGGDDREPPFLLSHRLLSDPRPLILLPLWSRSHEDRCSSTLDASRFFLSLSYRSHERTKNRPSRINVLSSRMYARSQ